MKIAALIPAAGSGTRLGKGPKAFLPLGEGSLLSHTMAAFENSVDEIVVAVSKEMQAEVDKHVVGTALIIQGGKTRQETVHCLLKATSADVVLIHDAARPFLPVRVIADSIESVKQHGAATVVRSVADTLIHKDTLNVVPRDDLRAVQTPQSFLRDLILRAHEEAVSKNVVATDDAALVRLLGHTVALVEGSSWLDKITTLDDYERAQALVNGWKGRKGVQGSGFRVQGKILNFNSHSLTPDSQTPHPAPRTPHTLLKAHAKVNLGLNIIAKRGDGFHEVDTLLARLELHDELTLEPRDQGISLTIENADLPTDNKNLAYRAAELYLKKSSETSGVHIHLKKNIPLAAGLAGGSSDAAAVLRGLAQLYPSSVDLLEIAKELGSDVAFFIQDLAAARARGRGEKLEPVTLPQLYIVLVNPGIHISAKEAYENLQNFSARLKLESVLGKLSNNQEPGYLNALQPGVMLLYPKVREVLTALRQTGLRGVMMSGSGSTCFGLASSLENAEEIAAKLRAEHMEWWIRATYTL
jgi:4-diphosphocytidyl-2-C-methyl-D-erythritol kinase